VLATKILKKVARQLLAGWEAKKAMKTALFCPL
jgi:hypothetical protein